MKKILSLCTLSLLFLSLTACGKEEESEVVTIEFMHTMVEQERIAVIDAIIADFESENPNINVEQVPVEEDQYNTKVVTLASSGELPAVVEANQDYAKILAKDELINIEAVNEVMAELGEDYFYEGASEVMKTEDGEGYVAVPGFSWIQGIWYNKAAFEEAGIPEPQTWEDILAAAEYFHDPENKKYGIAIPTAESPFTEQVFSQFALSNGANVIDSEGNININTPEMQEALTYYAELSQYTMPGSNDVTEVKDAFMSGSTPMCIYSSYILPAVYEAGHADNLGFFVPSKESAATYGCVIGYTITSGLSEEETAAAQEFVKYLVSLQANVQLVLMSPGSVQPVVKEVAESEEYLSNEVVMAFGELPAELAASLDDLQLFGLVDGKNYLIMGDVSASGAIGKMVNEATVGGVPVEEAIANAEETLSELTE